MYKTGSDKVLLYRSKKKIREVSSQTSATARLLPKKARNSSLNRVAEPNHPGLTFSTDRNIHV